MTNARSSGARKSATAGGGATTPYNVADTLTSSSFTSNNNNNNIIAVTHHMKPSRRQHGHPSSHFEMSVRFTTLFIIAIFLCEFSGLSQAVADAYTAVAVRFSSSSTSTITTSSSSSKAAAVAAAVTSNNNNSNNKQIQQHVVVDDKLIQPTAAVKANVVTSTIHRTITSSVVAVAPGNNNSSINSSSSSNHITYNNNNNNVGLVSRLSFVPLADPPDNTPFTPYYSGFHPDATVSMAMYKKGMLLPPSSSPPLLSSSSSPPTFNLETFWSKDDMDIKVCRLHNVCIRPQDNALLVHPNLRRYAGPMRDCNVRKLDYFTDPAAQYDANSRTSSYDLYGAAPARYHIPHFLTDILPVLFASELIWPSAPHPAARADCVDPGHRKCGRVADRGRAALFVEHRVLGMKVDAWVAQFAALMPGEPFLISPEVMHGVVDLDDGGEDVDDDSNGGVQQPQNSNGKNKDGNKMKKQQQENEQHKLACFKSVVSFPRHTYLLRSPEWFAEGNAMFTSHGLSRKSVIRPTSSSTADAESIDVVNLNVAHKTPSSSDAAAAAAQRQLDDEKKKRAAVAATPCPVHAVFVNRIGWEKRHGIHLGRDIINMDDVRAHVIRESKRIFNPPLELIVSVHYFENLTFAQQVRVMQAADVLIGVHGAGLSNVVFARRDTPLLEVFPFAYYAGPFGGVAQSLGLRYSYMVAAPDTKTFLECVELKGRKAEDGSVLPKVRNMWGQAVSKHRNEGDLDSLKTHTMRDFVGSIMKMCARSQRLLVDPVELGNKVLKMAQTVCGGTPPDEDFDTN